MYEVERTGTKERVFVREIERERNVIYFVSVSFVRAPPIISPTPAFLSCVAFRRAPFYLFKKKKKYIYIYSASYIFPFLL